MFLKYFYNSHLAQASYMVGCQRTGEAIVIDPGRDIEPYLETAENEGLRIIAATETHIHADFLSGSRELSARTGAKMILSDEGDENWKYLFAAEHPHQLVTHGDTFKIGNIQFKVMHTPGHTPEHICFILTDTAGADRPMGIFTGDFVFVGSTGRPDLLEKAANIKDTAVKGAQQMFRSVQRFKDLPDYLQVWPGHGAGSACGKGLGAIPSSTVGYEKLFNPMLRIESEGEFIESLLEGQPEPPKYFAMMKKLNKEGPAVLHEITHPPHLAPESLPEVQGRAPIIDTRSVDQFAAGHIPGTINIPAGSSFVTWAGWFLDYDEPFYLIAAEDQIDELTRDLISIGLDNAAGFWDLSVLSGAQNLQKYRIVDAPDLADEISRGEVTVVDVRDRTEFEEGHIPQARHIMLGYLLDRLADVPQANGSPVVLQCRSGNRSAIAASILQARGIENVINMMGGIELWERNNLPVVR